MPIAREGPLIIETYLHQALSRRGGRRRVVAMRATLILILAVAVVGCGASKEAVVKQANVCRTNLKTLDAAIITWTVENRVAEGAEVSMKDLEKYFEDGVPACPSGGEYTLTSAKGERCACSIHSDDQEE